MVLAYIAAVVTLLITPLSAELWRVMTVIYKIQFPWRLTAVLGFALTICYALLLEAQKISSYRLLFLILPIGLCVALPLVIGFSTAMQVSDGTVIDNYDGISKRSYQMYVDGKRPSFNAYEYELAPIKTLEKYRYFDFVEVSDENASYEVLKNEPRSLSLNVQTSQIGSIRVKRQAYYGTEIYLNGERVDNDFDREMIVLDLVPGKNTIQISLKRMPIEIAGYWASLASFVLFLLLLASMHFGWLNGALPMPSNRHRQSS